MALLSARQSCPRELHSSQSLWAWGSLAGDGGYGLSWAGAGAVGEQGLACAAPVLGSAWDHGQEPYDALQPGGSSVLHGAWQELHCLAGYFSWCPKFAVPCSPL